MVGPRNELMNQHILTAQQFTKETLHKIFDFAGRMIPIAQGDPRCQVLDGYVLGSFFFEESTRTRLSSEFAFMRLGGDVIQFTDMQFSSMFKKGESLEDTAKVLSKYCDAMAVRHPEAGKVKIIASNSKVPVINGGDGDEEHPTQMLLDLYTIYRNLPDARGVTILMDGDLKHSRTAHSLVHGLLTFYEGWVQFIFVSPSSQQMPPHIKQKISKYANSGFKEYPELSAEIISRTDAVYMIRPQKERWQHGPHNSASPPVVLNRQLLEEAGKAPLILHPLPRNAEISRDIDDLPNALYLDEQIDNGIAVRMSLFVHILDKLDKFP